MKNILGIGGVFFRAHDPAALKKWYTDVFGLVISDYVWQQEAGPTVFEPFPINTDHFPGDKQFMLNFRVSNLKDLLADLESKGVKVETREEWNRMPEFGAFARAYDPEGNPLELWQPAKE